MFGISLISLKHDGISGNQRTSQSLHVGVENGSNNFSVAYHRVQQKLVFACKSFQHHSDDRVDLMVLTILDPTRRIFSKGVPGRV